MNETKTYEEIVATYRKRQKQTVVDSLAAGLTYVDEIAVDVGVLEEAGLMNELTSTICGALPFVIIAVTEGTKVVLGRKPIKNGTRDAASRMAKTGVALGAGALVTAAAGFWAAIPATIGARAMFDRYKSMSLETIRVKHRIGRLQALREQLEEQEDSAKATYGMPSSLSEAIPVEVIS